MYDPHHHQRRDMIPHRAMTPDEREAFEERAAILEYDTGMTRKEAERKALEMVKQENLERAD